MEENGSKKQSALRLFRAKYATNLSLSKRSLKLQNEATAIRMSKSIFCSVESPQAAREVIDRLQAAGFLRSEIEILFTENANPRSASAAANAVVADTRVREPERVSVRKRGERWVAAFRDWQGC